MSIWQWEKMFTIVPRAGVSYGYSALNIQTDDWKDSACA